jgi:uncharacterized membrane protein
MSETDGPDKARANQPAGGDSHRPGDSQRPDDVHRPGDSQRPDGLHLPNDSRRPDGLHLPDDPYRSLTATDRRGVRSVSRAMRALKAGHAADRTVVERFADALTRAASSALFFNLHVVWFVVWIVWNTGTFGLVPFDPFPFGLLTMVVSLEAIFLSMFVLMAQSRESAIAELREELTLQVNLRIEQEVTKTLQLVAGLYTRMGYKMADDPELMEMLKPLDAEGIEKELLAQIHNSIYHRSHDAP